MDDGSIGVARFVSDEAAILKFAMRFIREQDNEATIARAA